ncbi:MAG: hypothetical protein KIT43_12390 [Bauldia sp.]|nr:hypothetical protein [Bauldia sp.]
MRVSAIVAAGLAACLAAGAAAAAIVPPPDTGYGIFRLDAVDSRIAYLDGPIEEHASDDFVALVLDHPDVALLVLDSPGGLTEQARVISELVYALGIDTFVPEGAGCYSACSTIFFGGTRRVAVGELGVHRSYSDEVFVRPDEIALLLGFTLESWMHFGIPLRAILATYRTPNEDIHVFTPGEIAEINRGTLDQLNRMNDDLLARIAATSGVRYVALDRNFDVDGEYRGALAWSLTGPADDPAITATIAIAEADLEVGLEIARLGNDGATRIDVIFRPGEPRVAEYIERLTVDTAAGEIVDLMGSATATGENTFRIVLPARWSERNDELLFDHRGFTLVFSYADGSGGALLIGKLSAAQAVFADAASAWGRSLPDPAAATRVVLDMPPDPPKVVEPLAVEGTATWAFDASTHQAIVTFRFPEADIWGRASIGRLEGGRSIKVEAAAWSYPTRILHGGLASLEGIGVRAGPDGGAVALSGELLRRGFSLQIGDTDIPALLAGGWLELTFANVDGTPATIAVELGDPADDVLAHLFGELADAP